jgi:F-type H+-transporting ATPase subunit gamma
MAGLKEIKRRLQSVKNTKKTTYAMKLVSAAKLRRVQDAVTKAREYVDHLYALIGQLSESEEAKKLSHPLMERRDCKRILLLVIGGQRGLAGGYNTNLNKKIKEVYAEYSREKELQVDAIVFGKKPAEFFRRTGIPFRKAYEDLADDPLSWPLPELCADIEERFARGDIDQVNLVYTEFRTALSVTPKLETVLPLDKDAILKTAHSAVTDEGSKGLGNKVIFEPSAAEVLAFLIPRIFRSIVQRACFNSKASEQGSRMTAMDAATKNAGDLIYQLQLKYNKLRQSGITSELLDILGGAEAVK